MYDLALEAGIGAAEIRGIGTETRGIETRETELETSETGIEIGSKEIETEIEIEIGRETEGEEMSHLAVGAGAAVQVQLDAVVKQARNAVGAEFATRKAESREATLPALQVLPQVRPEAALLVPRRHLAVAARPAQEAAVPAQRPTMRRRKKRPKIPPTRHRSPQRAVSCRKKCLPKNQW